MSADFPWFPVTLSSLFTLLAGCGAEQPIPIPNEPDAAGTSGSGGGTGGAPQPTGGTRASGGTLAAAGTATGGAAGQAAGGRPASGGASPVACDKAPSAAPSSAWVNATGNLANMASECGNLGLVSAQPCSNRVIAGVAKQGLWETVDGGTTWTQMGKGNGSATITNRISALVYDPKDPNIFWESGIYNDGGIYKTTDSGVTFQQLGSITHSDSVSIDFGDPERKTLLAGSHETSATLHLSVDSGATWVNIAAGLPQGHCTATHVVDARTYLVGCNSGTIQRSIDGGANWAAAPGSMGGVFQPLLASDQTIYWPGSSGGVSKSTDGGETFSSVASSAIAPAIIAPAQIAELPDGRIVIVGTDHLLISADKGATWNPLGDAMPYAGGGFDGARGVAYSAQTKTLFIWRWDCGATVPPNAIMSMGFDWETQ